MKVCKKEEGRQEDEIYFCERMRGGSRIQQMADGGHPQKLLDGMAECQNESTFSQSSTKNKYYPTFPSYSARIQIWK